MTNTNDTSCLHDWNKLAQEALDLWEGHLNAISSDPKAKEDMARFIAPMSQMFANWTSMMQSGLQGAGVASPSAPTAAASPEEEEEPYDVWMEEMLNASNPSYGATSAYATASPVEAEAATAAPFAVKTSALDMVDVSDTTAPYAVAGGVCFASLQEAMPDYYKSIIHPESISVVESHVQSEVVADGSVGFRGAQPAFAHAAAPVCDVSDAAEPVIADAPVATPASERAFAPAGSRDLAELASRLAQLERELDGMRAKDNGRFGAADAADLDDDADARRMALARQR